MYTNQQLQIKRAKREKEDGLCEYAVFSNLDCLSMMLRDYRQSLIAVSRYSCACVLVRVWSMAEISKEWDEIGTFPSLVPYYSCKSPARLLLCIRKNKNRGRRKIRERICIRKDNERERARERVCNKEFEGVYVLITNILIAHSSHP